MTNPISAMLTSLPLEFELAVHQAAALGFRYVDVVAQVERPQTHLEALADAGVIVSCCPVGRGLAPGLALDAADVADRRTALSTMERHIADAARLGATHAYVVPGTDASNAGLARFADACAQLAEFAVQRMVKLCVEHVPGRALSSAAATLAWLEQLAHTNLFLLMDVGHCLISGEDAAGVVQQAGARFGYVHFDDNDGKGDVHWPLLAGRLKEEGLQAVCGALVVAGYRAAVALELNPQNADPVAALREGKALLERLQGE
jgi:D-psicose/D-tagatose/L-ribulose 3-epimerase